MFSNDENFRYDHESQDLRTLDINEEMYSGILKKNKYFSFFEIFRQF